MDLNIGLFQIHRLLMEQLLLQLQLHVGAVQPDKAVNFRFEHLRHKGLADIINGAQGIRRKINRRVLVRSGNKNNRRITGTLSHLDILSRLQTIHIGHMDVQDNHGKISLKHLPQRFMAGRSLHQLIAFVGQHRLQSKQIFGMVIHQQYLNRCRRFHLHSSLCSQTFNSDSSLLISIGLVK
ncbi:hypothetical protein D3C75_705390 [compost metagenome]